MDQQVLTMLNDQVGTSMLGTVFLFVGLAACGVSAIRGRREDRILAWFGLLNLLWGIRILVYSPAAFSVLLQSLWASRLSVIAILSLPNRHSGAAVFPGNEPRHPASILAGHVDCGAADLRGWDLSSSLY
jgi:hypothetical protein